MTTKSGFTVVALGVVAATALSACGETKLLGGRTLPDETQVIDGPSLALPPSYELRPPREAQDYESVLRAQKATEARTLITGDTSGTVAVPNVPANDQWLIDQTGKAQPDIREQLEQDAKAPESQPKPSVWKRWFGSDKQDDEE